jgi:hypothetical protein
MDGEAEGLRVSLDAATSKLAQANMTAARRAETVSLGIPAYRDIAAATLAAPADPWPADHLTATRPAPPSSRLRSEAIRRILLESPNLSNLPLNARRAFPSSSQKLLNCLADKFDRNF